jgi:hypothetical protein
MAEKISHLALTQQSLTKSRDTKLMPKLKHVSLYLLNQTHIHKEWIAKDLDIYLHGTQT